jgi:hypothetical protein
MNLLSPVTESTTHVTSMCGLNDNPHGTLETHFQCCFFTNVWCGTIDDMLIGPVILDDRMT